MDAPPQKFPSPFSLLLRINALQGWRRLKGANQLPMVIEGVKFIDGVLDAKNRAA